MFNDKKLVEPCGASSSSINVNLAERLVYFAGKISVSSCGTPNMLLNWTAVSSYAMELFGNIANHSQWR